MIPEFAYSSQSSHVHHNQVQAVMLGIGAAFDFHVGRIHMPLYTPLFLSKTPLSLYDMYRRLRGTDSPNLSSYREQKFYGPEKAS